MHPVLQTLGNIGIVPVVKLEDAQRAPALMQALRAGYIDCAEITFRTAQAKAAISNIATSMPDALVGAGTVLSTAQVDEAVAAGAKFIVSPGFNPQVVEYCISRGVPIVPGCSGPSDIERAIGFRLEVVKFFPAEVLGGAAAVKALSAPYGAIRFMPTGGVNSDNMNSYLRLDAVAAVGGAWMVPEAAIDAEDFEAITALSKAAVGKMLGFELAHVGINCSDDEQARKAAKLLCALFGFPLTRGETSDFAGSAFELAHAPGRGEKGHIAVATNSIDRAAWHLTQRGFEFDAGSAIKDAKGKLKAVYLKDEIAGFAIHLLKR